MKIENTIFPSWMVLGIHSDGSKRITEGGILCSLDNPVKHRKTRNMFKFSAKDLEKVQDNYSTIKNESEHDIAFKKLFDILHNDLF